MLNKIVFDLETQKEFAEVGGRGRNHLLRVSVAVAYSYPENKFFVFEEKTVHKLGELLQEADVVVGYNIVDFDYQVLQPYFNYTLDSLPTLDLLVQIERVLGHRISLDAVASATLDAGKSASGLDAIKFWRLGQMDKLKEYCINDVKITRLVYEYALEHGKLFYKDFFKKKEFPIHLPQFVERVNKQKQISLF